MRIRRILAMLAIMATIGSFLVEMWQVSHWDSRSDQRSDKVQPQATAQEIHRVRIRDTPLQDLGECDLTLLAAAVEMLRKKKARSDLADTARFLRLAEDSTHIYIVDQAAGTLHCVQRPAPVTRAVLASASDEQGSNRREVIFWAVVVIVLASIGLAAIQLVRED